MSLERLTIHLHCWPTRRPPRRAPSRSDRPTADDAPTGRFPLADVTLDGDDVRDVERFDVAVAEALIDAATRLARVPTHRLVDLRSIGYATRLEISTTAAGALELALPLELIAACRRLELNVQVASDDLVSAVRDREGWGQGIVMSGAPDERRATMG